METNLSFEIKTPADVAKFFFWIVFEKHIDFHPDDDFEEYVDEDGEYVFSDEDAGYLTYTMSECFEVCKQYGRSIYHIACIVKGAFFYCDCNDDMAKFLLDFK